jgi:hypothetical protein
VSACLPSCLFERLRVSRSRGLYAACTRRALPACHPRSRNTTVPACSLPFPSHLPSLWCAHPSSSSSLPPRSDASRHGRSAGHATTHDATAHDATTHAPAAQHGDDESARNGNAKASAERRWRWWWDERTTTPATSLRLWWLSHTVCLCVSVCLWCGVTAPPAGRTTPTPPRPSDSAVGSCTHCHASWRADASVAVWFGWVCRHGIDRSSARSVWWLTPTDWGALVWGGCQVAVRSASCVRACWVGWKWCQCWWLEGDAGTRAGGRQRERKRW